jgi:hypothetical protein
MSSASACAGPKVIDVSHESWYVALQAYAAGDIPGAEQQLLGHPDVAGLGVREIISLATKRGDIDNALRFADLATRLNYNDRLGWRPMSARAIGYAWAKKDKPSTVVRWAHSRPTRYEQAMALLGVAEAMADVPTRH